MERHVLGEFVRELGWGDEAAANFTSGGAEANHSGVIVGLTAKLEGFAEHGLDGRRPTVYVSAEAHHSFVKVGHACGLGRSAIRQISTDLELRMDGGALQRQIEADRKAGFQPTVLVATLGTTSAGAIDPIRDLSEIAARENLWLHADAAWGGAALLVPGLRHHLDGIGQADSITIDAHKWLSVPMGAGMFFCRDARHASEAFGIQTAYMPAKHERRDPYTHTLQWSRRFNGLKLFMAMATQGRIGYAERVAHQAAMADLLARRLEEIGWRVVHHSPFAVVTFLPPEDRDLDALVARIYERGEVWISKTVLSHHGEALRACMTNHRTQAEYVEQLVSLLLALS
jgi:glutamate/tyrosine decarboxylase-like PLP-dependent enzyme